MVISPSLGSRLSNGMYCLIARCKTSFCDTAVAWAYSLMCWHSKTCSLISKIDDMAGGARAWAIRGGESRKVNRTNGTVQSLKLEVTKNL
jgi:hypothetical protein